MVLAVFTGTLLFSQNGREGTRPVARAAKKGIWVYTGNIIPRGFSYTIERKLQNSNRYETIGKAYLPKSLSEFESLSQKWAVYFNKLDNFSKQEIQTLWNYLQKNTTTDSLRSNNLPLMHLIAGTAILDTTVEKGQAYIYRIHDDRGKAAPESSPETPPVSWPASPQLPVLQYETNKYANGKLALEWSTRALKELAHFNIYRSVFGKSDFRKINTEKGVYQKNGAVILLAIDSIGTKPVWYEYQLEPVDIYGNAGKTGEPVAGGSLSEHYATPVKQLKATGQPKGHQIRLSWKYENKKYLNGISIMRSNHFDSGYHRIASVPVTDTAYTDIIPVAGENYYYYLLLYSAANEPVATAKVAALYYTKTEKPTPPEEADAETIPNGIRVHWRSNGPYVTGFYVYRNTSSNEKFIQVSGLVPAGGGLYSFDDTSKNLQAGEVYLYAVKSVNDVNQFSDFSDTVSAYPGIAAKLTTPGHLRYRINNNTITLAWDDLRPIENNLLGYRVYRRSSTAAKYQALEQDISSAGKNFYIDSTVQPGGAYEYAVTALDFFGNESPLSDPVKAGIAEEIPPVPSGITAQVSGNTVILRWGQLDGNDVKVKIYRSEPGQKQAVVIGTVDSFEETFTDTTVVKKRLYFYQLSAINSKNKESHQSEKLSVRAQ